MPWMDIVWWLTD
uniref:Uncharacterized protein n=1 Tax=Pseudomonas putida TaxID=303 RepID=A0A0N9MWS7_PSEPU|nr:hypothetical protein [Pseudomonas putida]